MKIYFAIGTIFILAATTINATGQTVNKQEQTSTDTVLMNRLALIKQQFAAINAKLTSYKKISKDIFGESAEGGDIVKYYSGTAVKKIKQNFYGETGSLTEEFYYDSGVLIFYYSVQSKYDKPLNIAIPKIIAKPEQRCYFFEGKIIKYIYAPAKTLANKQIDSLNRDIITEANKALKRK